MVKFINFIKLIKSYFAVSFLIIILLASSWSLFRPGFFRAHDFVHGARIAEMTRALQDGHFPVRWSENFGYGLGMPLFEFYAPLPFYVGALFYWLGTDLILSIKLLFLISNIVSVLGAYKLGRTMFGVRGGIITSAAFTLAPYRAVNLFIRGAISEAWGMMALPWILYGIVLIAKKNEKSGWLILILGLVTLMLSHNLTTLMFVPMSVVFALAYLLLDGKNRINLKKKILSLGSAYLLAGGLSSFYMLPAFVEKSLTQIDTILGGYFHYSNHFLYVRQFSLPNWGFGGSGWGPDDDISFFLGYGQLIALFISVLAFLFYAKKKKLFEKKALLNYFRGRHTEAKLYIYPVLGLLLATGLYMSILKSKWLWDSLPLLNFIQFPWRFLSVSILFVALITALNIKLIPNIVLRFVYFVVIFWIIVLGNFYYFRPEKFLENPAILYYADENLIRNNMSDILRDYVPVQMSLDGNELRKLYQETILPAESTLQIDKTQQKFYKIGLENESQIEFPISNFPGWRAEIDGQKAEIVTAENGLVSLTILEGEHQIGLYFGHSPIRLMADVISLVSFIILLAALWSDKSNALHRIN